MRLLDPLLRPSVQPLALRPVTRLEHGSGSGFADRTTPTPTPTPTPIPTPTPTPSVAIRVKCSLNQQLRPGITVQLVSYVGVNPKVRQSGNSAPVHGRPAALTSAASWLARLVHCPIA